MSNFKAGVISAVVVLAAALAPAAHADTAYSTFSSQPYVGGQQPGFGFYGGASVVNPSFANSFTSSLDGYVSDIWVAADSSFSSLPPTAPFSLSLETVGAQGQPANVLGTVEVDPSTEATAADNVFKVSMLSQGVSIQAGQQYWLVMSQLNNGAVAWLGGLPNNVAGEHSAYAYANSPSGWVILSGGNGAMRIDVTAVPEPSVFMLMGLGLAFVGGAAIRRRA